MVGVIGVVCQELVILRQASSGKRLEMGVAAGVHITTLPAIPVARFEAPTRDEEFDFEAQLSSPSEWDTVDTGL